VKIRTKEIEVPSIPAADDITAFCGLCQEKFTKFFDQEQEEWMYRDAVRMNQQLYHSTCYRDLTDHVGSKP
jgi:pre-mRNA cleavage complex 2 protein Pcf11